MKRASFWENKTEREREREREKNKIAKELDLTVRNVPRDRLDEEGEKFFFTRKL